MSRIHEALKRAERDRAATQQVDGPSKESIGQQASSQAVQVSTEPEPSPTSAPVVLSDSKVLTDSSKSKFEEWRAKCVRANWNPDPNFLLFSSANPFPAGAEKFRTLRSRLYRVRESQPLRRLLVSSAIPAEGKTFVSANLAQVLVRQGESRVLLIDADLRSPRLHKIMGAPSTPGLADYLQGDYEEWEVIQRGKEEGFFFLPAGKHVTHPAELIASKKFKTFLAHVSDLFDWVVIDSPPALPVSDASVLATMCDGILFVVRAASTPAEVSARGCRELQDGHIIGVVLNGLEKEGTSDPYYGYGTAAYGSNVSGGQGKS
jgi:capsular exopolysaccharide synthesis family protein